MASAIAAERRATPATSSLATKSTPRRNSARARPLVASAEESKGFRSGRREG
jgi:hypothetical protein